MARGVSNVVKKGESNRAPWVRLGLGTRFRKKSIRKPHQGGYVDSTRTPQLNRKDHRKTPAAPRSFKEEQATEHMYTSQHMRISAGLVRHQKMHHFRSEENLPNAKTWTIETRNNGTMKGRTGEIMIHMSYQNPYHRDKSKCDRSHIVLCLGEEGIVGEG